MLTFPVGSSSIPTQSFWGRLRNGCERGGQRCFSTGVSAEALAGDLSNLISAVLTDGIPGRQVS